MNRTGLKRIKRRAHIRLSLEHLEHRRLMAGLNVYVFADQDGSRSLSRSVDTPAPNRLVYVDLNRDMRFQDGEPLAVSGEDGMARFPSLTAGDYLIGLAANNAAQLVTTSVVPDARAQSIAQASASSGPLQSLISSSDLTHAWSASTSGVLTPVGSSDSGRAVLKLGGPLVGLVSGPARTIGSASDFTSSGSTSAAENVAWALVDQGQAQPTLYRLDLETGSARVMPVMGLGSNQRAIGLARSGSAVYVQLASGDTSYIAALNSSSGGVTLGARMLVPNGQLISSSVSGRLAVLGNRTDTNGERDGSSASVTALEILSSTVVAQTAQFAFPLTNVSFSSDGRWLFASQLGGGVDVLSVAGGLTSAAYLAEASGPVSAGRDGRFLTANSTKSNELILWDSRTWTPTNRIELAAGLGPVVDVKVDSYGQRLLAVTAATTLGASLANPVPQMVQVTRGSGTTQTSIGVRLVERPQALPESVKVQQVTDEDSSLTFELSTLSALSALGSGSLMFAPASGTDLGTLLVTPLGRVTYRPQANANGADSATLRLYDGINATSLVISINVEPVNDAPSAFTLDPVDVEEAASVGTLAGYATIYDVDSDARYEITTSDPRFSVVRGEILLTADAQLDFETEAEIDLEITATDLDNPAFVITRRITIPVLNSNDAPTGVDLSTLAVSENAEGSAVGSVIVVDPDEHGSYVYSVSDHRFEVVSGLLKLRSGVSLNFEFEPTIPLSLIVTDPTAAGAKKSVTSDMVIQVLDSNDAPIGFTVSGSEIPSGKAGAVVGTIDVIDEDVVDNYTYEVSDSRFTVDGNVLRLKDDQAVSRETEPTLSVLVSVADSAGVLVSQTVTVTVVSSAPFQNPRDPLDVDGDGFVYPRDALLLVNRLNQRGSHMIEPISGEGDSPADRLYIDVNGDGMLTPLDALILINYLNRRSAGTVSTSGTGNPGPPPLREKDAPQAGTSIAEGEGLAVEDACPPWQLSVDDSASAPQPVDLWVNSQADDDRAQREAIDTELEWLINQLSHSRVS